jgi:hypothetical protein
MLPNQQWQLVLFPVSIVAESRKLSIVLGFALDRR